MGNIKAWLGGKNVVDGEIAGKNTEKRALKIAKINYLSQ